MDDAAQTARFREQEEKSTLDRALILGLPYFDTRELNSASALIQNILSNEEMYKGKLVPIIEGDQQTGIIFGVTTQTPQSLLRTMRDNYNRDGKNISFHLISNSGFRELMLRFDPPKKIVYDDVKIAGEGDSDTINEVSKTLESVRSDDVLNYLITQADTLGASDIHIENQRKNVSIRLRVDGTLHPVATITHDKYRVLQASIATKANVSTAAKEAQTGHMQHVIKNADNQERLLNMRIETVPTIYGQDAVIRMFNFDENLLRLDRLGLSEEQQKPIQEIIEHPHGLVLVVGPTGSGKSTTLYSILNALNNPSRKIVTLEDPVEISVPGIVQIPVNTGEGDSFAEKLRAVLRLDPDIIMVGEIRDVDTAKTAIQASITGHLVLATFHAASAAAAFSRLIDMIGQNPIFASAVRLVIGQRLVRRLDDSTRQEYEADEAIKKWLNEMLNDLTTHVEKPNLDNVKLFKAGKSEENPFGYKGRILLMEQMVISPEIQAFLKGSVSNVNAEEIEKKAKEQGMVTIAEDGVLRALKGETTIEEVNRVI